MIRLFTMLALLLIGPAAFAQTNRELALQKAREAIRIEDEEGRYDDAIKLLEEAQRLDPDNIDHPYEIAYSYTAKKEYKKASDILEKLLKHKYVSALVYQQLGNNYDYQGKSEKAIKTYEAGLKKFPDAGRLYLELGNMQLGSKEYNKALALYEKGIEVDPMYPSNYYRATKLFLNSDEEVWGMIYGEIFMNLEVNSKRTEEVSKLLFDTYKSEITITSDTSYSVSFSKNVVTLSLSDLKDPKKFKLPFGAGCYEILMGLAVAVTKQVDLSSLNRMRGFFLDTYFEKGYDKSYPNALFDFQEKVKKAGHFEAYNYWILMMGDESGFGTWRDGNEEKWTAFTEWFRNNRLKLDNDHKFFRTQY